MALHNFNTSHVNVNRLMATELLFAVKYFNTSHVNVNHQGA